MLITPDSDNEKIRYLATVVVVVDEKNEVVHNVYSFNVETKEAHLFVLNEKNEVRVFEGKPVLEKKICPGWKVFNKFHTKIEITPDEVKKYQTGV